jgi:hypothetical protein
MYISHMEILESLAWIILGFLPMLGSMELVWRLSDRRKSKKVMIGMAPTYDVLQK